jgi:hypothetical protein
MAPEEGIAAGGRRKHRPRAGAFRAPVYVSVYVYIDRRSGRGISGPYGHEVEAGSSSSDDASWQISVVSTMSTVKHAKLAKYIQQHKKNWDLDFKVVMPGKAGTQLFGEYPLSDQSVVARAHGREGGKATKGMPNTGGSAKGVPKTGGVGQGGSPLEYAGEYRRHGDQAGFSSRLPAGR